MQLFAGAAHVPSNAFYLAVNLSTVWVAAPLAAILSKRHPLVGLAGYSVMAINFLTHIGAFIVGGYNPGLLTAVVFFLPITVRMATPFLEPARCPTGDSRSCCLRGSSFMRS